MALWRALGSEPVPPIASVGLEVGEWWAGVGGCKCSGAVAVLVGVTDDEVQTWMPRTGFVALRRFGTRAHHHFVCRVSGWILTGLGT